MHGDCPVDYIPGDNPPWQQGQGHGAEARSLGCAATESCRQVKPPSIVNRVL